MPFHVSRNDQVYGPYSFEDLQRYVASGNVLLTDLAKDDEASAWVPVSQVLAAAGAVTPAPLAPNYPNLPYPASTTPFPDPPNLQWGIVLLIDIFTCGFFQLVWNFIIAAWTKKLEPSSKALALYIVAFVVGLTNFAISIGSVLAAMRHQPTHPNYLGIAIGLIGWGFRVAARFSLRETLEQHYNGPEPLGLSINPVLTFFFGGIYHQYKLNEIVETKQAMRYRGAAV